jgi:hypothetical protein
VRRFFVMALLALVGAALVQVIYFDDEPTTTPGPDSAETVIAPPAELPADPPSSSSPSPAPPLPRQDPSTPELEPANGPSTAPSRPRYEDVAVQFLRAFARPQDDVDDRVWWAGVKPLLTEQAAHDYAGVDPRNVPFTDVTGPAVLVESEAPAHLLTIAQVPTDAGTYLVEMTTGPEGVRVARATPSTEGS